MAGAAANAALTQGRLRLGVNIDHVATIRNARGGEHPDPVRAAEIVAAVGGAAMCVRRTAAQQEHEVGKTLNLGLNTCT